jgi:hypothetical protein
MKTNPITLSILCGLTLLSLSQQGRAELIAYQGFADEAGLENPTLFQDDPAGKPVGAGGSGFQALKVPVNRGPLLVTDEGLSYSQGGAELKVTGRAVQAPGGQSPFFPIYAPYDGDPFENLRAKDDPAFLGREGKTLWVSWLCQVKGEVRPETVAVAKIGSDAIHAGLIHNAKSPEAFLRLISSSTGVRVEPGETYLMVMRIDYGSKEGGDDKTDRVMLWVNPDLGVQDPGVKPQVTVENVSARMGSFWFMTNPEGEGVTAIFDELRIGEEYTDVVPAP